MQWKIAPIAPRAPATIQGVQREEIDDLRRSAAACPPGSRQRIHPILHGCRLKGVRDGDQKFEQMLETIREVGKLGMEVCVTLGHLSDAEAIKLEGGRGHRL